MRSTSWRTVRDWREGSVFVSDGSMRAWALVQPQCEQGGLTDRKRNPRFESCLDVCRPDGCRQHPEQREDVLRPDNHALAPLPRVKSAKHAHIAGWG